LSLPLLIGALALLNLAAASLARADTAVPPDITVAADGSGDFTSVHAAVQSIPRDNRERQIIFIKDGVYTEKVRVDAANVTLRGQSRKGTRIEFSQAQGGGGGAGAGSGGGGDNRGNAVVNLSDTAHDCVIENLTIRNTHGVLGVHAFALSGRADRTVVIDSDVLSHGNDTIALWRTPGAGEAPAEPSILKDSGRYYHARLNVTGSVDFICPRGWCYMVDSTVTELNPRAEASMWHDGSNNPDKKFVMRRCRFDGPENFYLARHHHDAHFYFIDCTFAKVMRDTAPYRVVYPLDGGTATEADIRRNADLDKTNTYGERAYYFNSHREGANDYVWHRNNLSSAPGSPKPDGITAKWTFGGTWDPEDTSGPRIVNVATRDGKIHVKFAERVTVKGKPAVKLAGGATAPYDGGSGSDTLVFAGEGNATAIDLDGGVIIGTIATAAVRPADLTLPR
jgi:pectinesterase